MLLRILLLVQMGFCLLSCDKANDNESDSPVTGRFIDQELIGTWTMNYSSRDLNNGIISWIDSIRFEENNFGTQKTYRYSSLEQDFSFLYYTANDSLFLIQDKKEDIWIYTIKNDSLSMTSLQPHYSSYYAFKVYRKSKSE